MPAYLDLEVPGWVHDLPAEKFFHLLCGALAELAKTVILLARERNVGSVYRTERVPPNPWAGLPADFPQVSSASHGWAG